MREGSICYYKAKTNKVASEYVVFQKDLGNGWGICVTWRGKFVLRMMSGLEVKNDITNDLTLDEKLDVIKVWKHLKEET